MTATEYRAWLHRRDLTHEAAGRELGVHKSTSSRYADGSIEIPRAVAMAIKLLEQQWRRK